MKKCTECGGTGFLRKTKMSDGRTVYISGENTFDRDTGGGHKGYLNIKCGNCNGRGYVNQS